MLSDASDLIQAGDLTAKKRSSRRRASTAEPAAPRWRQVLLLLTIVPMAAGYKQFGIAPMVRKLCKETGFPLKTVYKLFPGGPAKGRVQGRRAAQADGLCVM